MAAGRSYKRHTAKGIERRAVVIVRDGKNIDVRLDSMLDIKAGDRFYLIDGDGMGNTIPFQGLNGFNVFTAFSNGYKDPRGFCQIQIDPENSYFDGNISAVYIKDYTASTMSSRGGKRTTIRQS